MGIIKIRHQGSVKDNYAQQFPLNFVEDELVQEDRFPSGEDYNNDPEESNFSDPGCEYALVNDQILTIPYELYELANLKDIMCLETWNSCLTEEERFHLAAYLPDMDPETFELTIIELLRGDNLYFGSPLEVLFHRLKGGFYSPQVTRFREGLRFLQERGHYHSLRNYHESMGQKFVEMRRAWRNSRPNTSVEERVQILKEKRNQNPVLLVDLNALPHDEEHPSKVRGLPRKLAFINDEERVTHVPPMDLNILNSRRKAKGVLKLKPPEVSSTAKKIATSLHSQTREPHRQQPKGVLKVKPKSTALVESLREEIVLRDRTSDRVFCSKLSPSHSAPQSVGDGSIYRGSPMPKINSLSICSRLSDNAQSFSRKKNMDKGMRMSSGDSSCFEGSFGVLKTGVIRPTSSRFHQSAQYNDRRKLMPLHIGVPDSVARNTIATIAYPMLPVSPNRSDYLRRDERDGEGIEKGCRFPITYKRKKPHTKLSTLRNQIKPSTVAGIAPTAADGTIFNQLEKTKTIRIRVKGWNDYKEKHFGSP